MAIRLVIDYNAESIVSVASQQVEMLIPPSDIVRNNESSYVDIIDQNNNIVYRRVLHLRSVEIFSPERIERRDVPNGVVVVLIPDVFEDNYVVLYYNGQENILCQQN